LAIPNAVDGIIARASVAYSKECIDLDHPRWPLCMFLLMGFASLWELFIAGCIAGYLGLLRCIQVEDTGSRFKELIS
jgi:hypothetical protein